MKYLPFTLVVTIGAILSLGVTSARALPEAVNPMNVNEIDPSSTTAPQDYNQAAALTTEAATISNRWGYGIEKTNNMNQSASSISIIREDDCRKLDPGELLSNPGSFFRECPSVERNQTPELGEKIEYFQVPKLDSGIKLQVTQF